MSEYATCDACAKLKRVTEQGLIAVHYVALRVSRSAVRYTGTGRVRRKCSGSGKAPRRPLGERL